MAVVVLSRGYDCTVVLKSSEPVHDIMPLSKLISIHNHAIPAARCGVIIDIDIIDTDSDPSYASTMSTS